MDKNLAKLFLHKLKHFFTQYYHTMDDSFLFFFFLLFYLDAQLQSMPLMKRDMLELLPPLSLPFLSLFLFLTKINPPLSDQISEETWNIWYHLATTIYSDSHRQNHLLYHHHLNLYLLPSLFFHYLPLVFRPFPSFISLFSPLFHLFPQLLKCRKIQKKISQKMFCE